MPVKAPTGLPLEGGEEGQIGLGIGSIGAQREHGEGRHLEFKTRSMRLRVDA